MKIQLLFLCIISIGIKGQNKIIDEAENDGYYLRLVEQGKEKTLEEVLNQFSCFRDKFTDRDDL
jgi:hypothetical protein